MTLRLSANADMTDSVAPDLAQPPAFPVAGGQLPSGRMLSESLPSSPCICPKPELAAAACCLSAFRQSRLGHQSAQTEAEVFPDPFLRGPPGLAGWFPRAAYPLSGPSASGPPDARTVIFFCGEGGKTIFFSFWAWIPAAPPIERAPAYPAAAWAKALSATNKIKSAKSEARCNHPQSGMRDWTDCFSLSLVVVGFPSKFKAATFLER